MKNVLVLEQAPHMMGVLDDLLRAYYPGIVIMTKSEAPQEAILRIEDDVDGGVVLTLEHQSKSYTQIEKPLPQGWPEDKNNQKRRLRRLALNKIITGPLRTFSSPWGILTGVRPTKIVHRFLNQGYGVQEVVLFLERDFGIALDKAQLLLEVALLQRSYRRGVSESAQTMSLYVSIPFCPTRCSYCSFPAYAIGRFRKELEPYLQTLYLEIRCLADFLSQQGVRIETVYIGGGTPSILSARQLSDLLQLINSSFSRQENAEITLEAGRPDTLDREKLEVLKAQGVNRLSINPQTMHQETLREIGRQHTVAQIEDAMTLAREVGFSVINMDLIVGLPGENEAMLQSTIESVLQLRPENITLHALAMKRAALLRQEGRALPPLELGKQMMDTAQGMIKQGGYAPYYLYRQKDILAHTENVGYTLPGRPCIYNIRMIEEQQTILGFGVGAGSKLWRREGHYVENIYNPKDLNYYRQRLEEILRHKVDKLRFIGYNN